MNKTGYIKLYRKIVETPLLRERPLCRMAAWISLLLSASYEEQEVNTQGGSITLAPGQMLSSIRDLASLFGWSRSKTQRFLKDLENEGMITIEPGTTKRKSTILTIINWSLYQVKNGVVGQIETSTTYCVSNSYDHKEAEEWDKCGTKSGTSCGTKSGTSCGTSLEGYNSLKNNGITHNQNEVSGTKSGTSCGTKSGTSCGTQEIYIKKNIKKKEEAKEESGAEILRKRIGAEAAILWVQTGIENLIEESKAGTLLEWLAYRNEKNNPLRTTHELFHLLRQAQAVTCERLKQIVDFSAGNGYSRLITDFDKAKIQTSTKNGKRPDFEKYYN